MDAEHAPSPKQLKVIGQLFNTYILIESPQGLMVVDQHIASERSCFEQLMNNTMVDTPEVQTLLTAKALNITPSQRDLLVSHQHDFETIGFRFELNADQVTLTTIPLIYIHKHDPVALFEDCIAQLEEKGSMALDMDLMIATMACHTAVRAGDPLEHQHMVDIIDQWLMCKLPWTCPHGRPIAHTIDTDSLNQFFHRPSLPRNAFSSPLL